MIASPSIAFNDFAGTAKDVTARQTKGRTVLSVRTKHSHVTSPKQAERRAHFSYITKQYKTLSEEQLSAWTALANRHTARALTENGVPLTGQNLYMCINANRAIVGVPMIKDAPAEIHGSSYVGFEDIWITPTALVIAGLHEPESEHSRLVVKIASTESNGVSKLWGETVIIGEAFDSDWGDVDLTLAYSEQFGGAIVPGRKYFIEMYWIDELSGYVSQVSRVCYPASESLSIHGKVYGPRIKMNESVVINRESEEVTALEYEVADGTGLIVVDAEARQISGFGAGISVGLEAVPSPDILHLFSYQWGRGKTTAKYPYAMQLLEVHVEKFCDDYSLYMSNRGSSFQEDFETFGTYQLFGLN